MTRGGEVWPVFAAANNDRITIRAYGERGSGLAALLRLRQPQQQAAAGLGSHAGLVLPGLVLPAGQTSGGRTDRKAAAPLRRVRWPIHHLSACTGAKRSIRLKTSRCAAHWIRLFAFRTRSGKVQYPIYPSEYRRIDRNSFCMQVEMRKKRKKRRSIKPKRGYQWLGAVWIGGISIFLTVGLLIEGQYTLGEPHGTLITADERPLTFWAGVAFPGTVGAAMIVFLIRGELQFRDQLSAYYQHELESQDE